MEQIAKEMTVSRAIHWRGSETQEIAILAAMGSLDACLWDYNIDEAQFRSILSGDLVLGRLDRD